MEDWLKLEAHWRRMQGLRRAEAAKGNSRFKAPVEPQTAMLVRSWIMRMIHTHGLNHPNASDREVCNFLNRNRWFTYDGHRFDDRRLYDVRRAIERDKDPLVRWCVEHYTEQMLPRRQNERRPAGPTPEMRNFMSLYRDANWLSETTRSALLNLDDLMLEWDRQKYRLA